MQKRTLGNSQLEVSALGLGCMGMSQSYLPIPGPGRDDRTDSRRSRTRRHVLRHRTGVRAVHERGARRRGPRARPRPGRDRDEVRLRLRRAGPRRPRQPPRDDQELRRRVAEAAPDGHDRPALPAPRRPAGADRGRRRRREGADRGGQGQALRPLRSGRADHPPRACRPARHGAAERVLAVVARARGRDPADARGARDRLRAVQPARQGFPHREDRRDHDLRRAPISATPSPASTRTRARRTARSSNCSKRSRSRRARRRRRSRSRGCSPRSRGWCRSPARRSCIASRRTSPQPRSS